MLNSPLEFLARQYGNVVKYDAEGNPSIFVKFPKMKSSNLDPSLPDIPTPRSSSMAWSRTASCSASSRRHR